MTDKMSNMIRASSRRSQKKSTVKKCCDGIDFLFDKFCDTTQKAAWKVKKFKEQCDDVSGRGTDYTAIPKKSRRS